MNKAEMIKALRNATQAGMADCIKALEESNGDLEKAQIWLREKGIARANKKASAVAYEGVVKAGILGNKAFIMELNCQTDFTAQNQQFKDLASDIFLNIGEKVHKSEIINPEIYLFNNEPLAQAGISLSAVTGEKIAFRRGQTVAFNSEQSIGAYTHSNNKIASVVLFKSKVSDDVAKDVAMHIAAMAPKYLNEQSVDQNWLASEKEILANQFREELTQITDEKQKVEKEKRADNIIIGKVKKLLKEICLVDQPFVKDNSKTVAQYVREHNSELLLMIRYELGEGIEKKENNFADEVAAQMGK